MRETNRQSLVVACAQRLEARQADGHFRQFAFNDFTRPHLHAIPADVAVRGFLGLLGRWFRALLHDSRPLETILRMRSPKPASFGRESASPLPYTILRPSLGDSPDRALGYSLL
jgi:hypothetical protein